MTTITPRLNEVQARIFLDRYKVAEDENTPEKVWKRVANAVAAVESEEARDIWALDFYNLLKDFKYVPGGRILAVMGTGATLTAQNCFVIPSPQDSRKGIMKSLDEWIEIQSKGGGVGINMSTLRPRGAPVKKVNGTSSGPVNWAQPFAFISKNVIIQGGSRRGAAMIMLDVDHPDIQEFIHAKETPGVLEGANVSVCISDAFMQAVSHDADWELKWGGQVWKVVKAKELWDEICQAAWASGEPGIYFLDRANHMANSGYFEQLIATNPCGEQPLGPYGACLLGAFNLNAYVKEDFFDWDGFRNDVIRAVRFNDNVVDASDYPLPECKESQQNIRRMGIGIMGLADVLIRLKIPYGSPDAIVFTKSVYSALRDSAYLASAHLAAERGAFPMYSPAYLEQPFIKQLPESIRDLIRKYGIRNCYLLTQAPTGTTALVAGVNSGIEPYFDFEYQRQDRTGGYDVVSEWADAYAAPNRPAYLVTAADVTPEQHVAMQAAAQQFCDSSISKTVNGPESHTVEDVKRLYMLAWTENLKSIAYYRDNSRQEQVLYHKTTEPAPVVETPRRRRLPDTRNSVTHRFSVDGQTGYMHTGLYDNDEPGEVFVTMSKEGSTFSGLMNWGVTMMSIALQYGAPLEVLTEKMIGTQFEPAGKTSDADIPTATSVIDYIGRWLNATYVEGYADFEKAVAEMNEDLKGKRALSGVLCECGREMMRLEGCLKCICGYSRC